MVGSHGRGLTFADLPGTLLEDLALAWADGLPVASHAAEYLCRIDGAPIRGRAEQLAGRAVLSLLDRRGIEFPTALAPSEVAVLGSKDHPEGDVEGESAYKFREAEYDELDRVDATYSPGEFAEDTGAALAAARSGTAATALPADQIATAFRLALIGAGLPAGLRAYFHERYGAGTVRADALAWRFVLTGRALAQHRAQMVASGVIAEDEAAVPAKLVEALLTLGLGRLARTALLESA